MASEQQYGARLTREIITMSGPQDEQAEFLQSLVTNDIEPASAERLVYAALLTPQGKYLSDFLVMRTPDGDFALDVAASQGAALEKRLSMYKLRRPVTLLRAEVGIAAIWGGEQPEGALADPRDPALGWRIYSDADTALKGMLSGDYDLHRLTLAVPESDADLISNDTYILHANFERLNGVDFKKGCYVGQEIVARMKHKTDLRKQYLPISLSDTVSHGETVQDHENKPVGIVYSSRNGIGLAALRLDRVNSAESLVAGGVEVNVIHDKS